ncbi:MAG TPA: acyloxyacyl hydrolase [Caulobacterales bacterium]|nr:acyloxyacyl hydrolase [Caulobacterales bacterium]
MRHSINGLFTAAAFGAALCGAGQARAEGPVDEVRFAVLDHDTGLVGNSKEGGFDIGVEVLSHPLSGLDIVRNPRLAIGGVFNSEHYTNQLYVGLVQQWDFAPRVFNDHDAFFLEGAVGVAYHDGKRDVRGTPEENNWKSHGSAWAFRTGWGVGYRFDERWSLQFSFHHMSNADLAPPNEGTNDVGLRLGVRL